MNAQKVQAKLVGLRFTQFHTHPHRSPVRLYVLFRPSQDPRSQRTGLEKQVLKDRCRC
jgi:hypothetical protein